MTMNRFSNMELLGLPDCMGLSDKRKCLWLNINLCKGEGCAFKRSVSDCKLSQLNTFQRLANLSSLQQTHISEMYYHGKKPWNKKQSEKQKKILNRYLKILK